MMSFLKIKGFVMAVLLIGGSTAIAKVSLPSLIGDNMVLQQKAKVCLWGTSTEKKVSVSVSWSDSVYSVLVDASGIFCIYVQTPSAGGPYDITFCDNEQLKVANVLIGEVWICSGQSNMDMPMSGFPNQPIEGALDDIMVSSRYPIHVFSVNRVLKDSLATECGGKWQKSTPETVSQASATAYYYAKYLHQTLNVPIGILVSSWGGTSILSWMSPEALKKIPEEVIANCVKRDSRKQNLPSMLFQSMINPLRNYVAKGFIWYQGEHNVPEYRYYAKMMQSMVDDWRKIWKDDKHWMPFYYVQIAPWRYFNNAMGVERPLLVEAQDKALSLISNSGMATTTDIGNEECIHPAKKREVGQRLAACALEKTYQIVGLHSNVFVEKEIEYRDHLVYLSFPTLKLGTSSSVYLGFEVAGENKIFYPAEAKLDKKRIRITSDKVKHPVALRYAFHNYVEATMKNALGIPFCSFRTDSWE